MSDKNKRIKNKFYLEFLEKGTITKINPAHIEKAAQNIKGQYERMFKVFLYVAYYTGARPAEILQLKTNDINREKQHIVINMPPAKNGLPRPIYLKLNQLWVSEIYAYSRALMPNMLLFWKLRGRYKRQRINRKGEVKEYVELSRRVRYYFESWFKGILDDNATPVPYHLRHNRFTKLAENGATAEDIRLMKGAKSYNSVIPYLHMSTDKAKSIAKKIE